MITLGFSSMTLEIRCHLVNSVDNMSTRLEKKQVDISSWGYIDLLKLMSSIRSCPDCSPVSRSQTPRQDRLPWWSFLRWSDPLSGNHATRWWKEQTIGSPLSVCQTLVSRYHKLISGSPGHYDVLIKTNWRHVHYASPRYLCIPFAIVNKPRSPLSSNYDICSSSLHYEDISCHASNLRNSYLY